jgi:hypothetical protein
MPSYGLDLAREWNEQDGTEYLAGLLPLCKAAGLDLLPFNEFKKYLPKGEVQTSAKDDMMDCASRDKINCLETKYNYLFQNNLLTPEQMHFAISNGYYTKNGFEFSDAFIAIKSGTTRQGNSLKAPLQAIHTYGLIPKATLPLLQDMTWEDYHNPKRITDAMEHLGQRWQEVMGEIFYEKESDYTKNVGLVTAVHAWPEPDSEGIYKSDSANFNHAVYRPKPAHYIFDNYTDAADDDFIKQTSPDFKFYPYGYTIVIGEPKQPEKLLPWPIDLIHRLLRLFTGRPRTKGV